MFINDALRVLKPDEILSGAAIKEYKVFQTLETNMRFSPCTSFQNFPCKRGFGVAQDYRGTLPPVVRVRFKSLSLHIAYYYSLDQLIFRLQPSPNPTRPLSQARVKIQNHINKINLIH